MTFLGIVVSLLSNNDICHIVNVCVRIQVSFGHDISTWQIAR